MANIVLLVAVIGALCCLSESCWWRLRRRADARRALADAHTLTTAETIVRRAYRTVGDLYETPPARR